MDAKRWQKINNLFDAAQEFEPEEREKFLVEACAGDDELRREVEKLLASFENAGTFLERPVAAEVAGLFEDEETLMDEPANGRFSRDEVFVAGTVLASRYRIVGLVGKGGMGEVYRAEDLKLSQPVALKFLPDKLEKDQAALERFIGEVRTARAVAHPNVCRVFDIGELDGRHFISMEYIDGDDLSSLLRRVGRLPAERAVEIARQLCLGLHAIHDAGILHRDFKPANIIIDSKGKARITDFGIAGIEAEIAKENMRVGTPAYMAPEQITGSEISARSDVYALGLVLYEIFTGKQAFSADSVADLLRKQQRSAPTNPSEILKDISPLVERAILQCLEKDAAERPKTALQVAIMLPGGNPLEAAIAAGETPSPEMVAAAPKKGALRPAVALALLAAFFLGTGLLIAMSKNTALHRFVPLDKSPEVLRERSRELAAKFGYGAADSHYGFVRELDYLDYVSAHDQSAARWEKLARGQPAVIKYWYRQSPEPLVPLSGGTVTTNDPPPTVSGMVHLYLDTEGRLVFFDAVPPRVDEDNKAAQNLDWQTVFQAAGLEPADFRETASEWSPVRPFDERRAWAGSYPAQPDIAVRVEAAAYRGRLVAFQIVEPWSKPAGQVPYQGGVSSDISGVILLATFFAVLFVGAWLAIKNVRGGRSDLRGTFRLTAFLFALRMLSWIFQTHHVASREELGLFLSGLQSGLFWAFFAGLLYLAFEPYLRKYAPERVISWNRLLAGDWRDPLVGRDVLIGGVGGLIMIVTISLHYFIPVWLLGEPPPPPYSFSNPGGAALLGIRGFPVLFLNQIGASLIFGFMISFLILFFTLILRRKWVGYAAFWFLMAAFAVAGETTTSNLLSGAIWAFLFPTYLLIIATRFGVLAIVSGFVVHHLVVFYPVTSELGAWYAGDFVLCLLALLALAFYGFHTSLAGQKIFEPGFLKDLEG